MTTLRTRRVLVALLTAAVFVSVTAVTVADPYWGPGYTSCGRHTYKTHESGTVRVYIAARHTSCRTALKVQREFWTAPASRTTVVNGGSGAGGYVLLKRYPGWRCGSGAGAGSCQRGKRFAGYSYRRS